MSVRSNYKGKKQLYLLVEDAVLLIDICDISCVLVRTLSGELASLVDADKIVINGRQGAHTNP